MNMKQIKEDQYNLYQQLKPECVKSVDYTKLR